MLFGRKKNVLLDSKSKIEEEVKIKSLEKLHKKCEEEVAAAEASLLRIWEKMGSRVATLPDGFPLLKERIDAAMKKAVGLSSKNADFMEELDFEYCAKQIEKHYLKFDYFMDFYKSLFRPSDQDLEVHILNGIGENTKEMAEFQLIIKWIIRKHLAFFRKEWLSRKINAARTAA